MQAKSSTHPPPYASVAAMDEMLTMWPLLRSIMPSTNAFVKAMTAVTLVSIIVTASWAGQGSGGKDNVADVIPLFENSIGKGQGRGAEAVCTRAAAGAA